MGIVRRENMDSYESELLTIKKNLKIMKDKGNERIIFPLVGKIVDKGREN